MGETSDQFKAKFEAMTKEELRDHYYKLQEKQERLKKKLDKLSFEEICAFGFYERKYGLKNN
jgi:hypothetical protein